ncbi:MAG: hypothetical protein KGI71_05745 [Patescibacteria group bacterium]|nr:hypothetical protein [Patescibacteria group bacterium]
MTPENFNHLQTLLTEASASDVNLRRVELECLDEFSMTNVGTELAERLNDARDRYSAALKVLTEHYKGAK